MIVLMLDACCVFHLDEPLGDGPAKAHGLNAQVGEKMQETLNTLFARACAPGGEAADKGKHATNTGTVMLSLICVCVCNALQRFQFTRVSSTLRVSLLRTHILLLHTGAYMESVVQHLSKPNQDVHMVFRRIGRAVFLATGGAQSPVRQRSSTTLCHIS